MRDASRALTADLHNHVSSVEGNGPKSTVVPYPDAYPFGEISRSESFRVQARRRLQRGTRLSALKLGEENCAKNCNVGSRIARIEAPTREN